MQRQAVLLPEGLKRRMRAIKNIALHRPVEIAEVKVVAVHAVVVHFGL